MFLRRTVHHLRARSSLRWLIVLDYRKLECYRGFSVRQKYKRRWVVLKMEFSPVDCRLEHYDKEASWQNKKEGQVENLVEMEDVRVIADNEKDHVLELVFLHRSLFLSFDSTTKLNTWKQKLGCLLGERHNDMRAFTLFDLLCSPLHGTVNGMP